MVTTHDNTTELKAHPAADIFPLMQGDEYEGLIDSIRTDGLELPIMLHEGMILDGRNRYRACLDAGVEPRLVEWEGKGSPARYVWKLNLHRRHLNPGQKAMCSLAFLASIEVEEKEKGGRGKTYDGAVVGIDRAADRRAEDARSSAGQAAAEADVGITTMRLAKRVEAEDKVLAEDVRKGTTTVEKAARELTERKRQAARDANAEKIAAAPKPETLVGVYSTIVIDPPWSWDDEGDGDGSFGRTKPTYETMPIDDIAKLTVGELAAEDCHLYLWITSRSLPKGFGLIKEWGFEYITALAWVKPHYGMGRYFRGQHEHVLFARRGSMDLKVKDQGTVFEAPRGPKGHSSKPVEFYDIVERCSHGPYLEMFARGERDGWTSWGSEVL